MTSYHGDIYKRYAAIPTKAARAPPTMVAWLVTAPPSDGGGTGGAVTLGTTVGYSVGYSVGGAGGA